jgi:cytochrome c
MPNRNGFTTAHGFMHRDGKPDTRNRACMRDCVREVRLSSEIPEYARDQHGNVADQVRKPDRTAPGAVAAKGPLDLARSAACMACHGVADKLVGPGFREVAARYAGDPGAESRLVGKVKGGGSGAWGAVPMPAQPQVTDADARTLVQWILAGAR